MIILGDKLKWHQQIRFRHVTTRKYLSVGHDLKTGMIDDGADPHTVFKLHSVIQVVD